MRSMVTLLNGSGARRNRTDEEGSGKEGHCESYISSEPLWDFAIRTGQVLHALPLLEAVLSAFGERPSPADSQRPRAVRDSSWRAPFIAG